MSAIYLDHAAATPLDPDVLTVMQPYFTELFYNPSASYLAARDVRHAIDAARNEVAYWLGSKPNEVIFTAGGTEANNLAIHGIMRQYPDATIVVSAIEHESILVPAAEYLNHQVAVHPDGQIDLNALKQAIDDKTVLVSIMYANNEIGTIQPLREVGKIVAAIRKERLSSGNKLPIYLHSDACQASNYLDLHIDRLGVDLLTINGGKIYGPKASGVLYIKTGVQLQPLILGGGQERNLRSGTEQVPNIIGLAAALKTTQTQRHIESRRLEVLQHHFYKLLDEKLPQAVINGSKKHRLSNNLHITLPGHDNERLLFALDEAGIQAAAGSACNASNEEPSHVLRALGVSERDAQASLRLTMGRSTDEAAIERLVDVLQQATIA
jgi:cysteine desulfurase